MKRKHLKNITGATMTEYVLLIGMITAAGVLAIQSTGTNIGTFFTSLATRITSSGSNL